MAAFPPHYPDSTTIEIHDTACNGSDTIIITATDCTMWLFAPPPEPKPVFERQMKWPRPKKICLAKHFFRPRTAMSRTQTRRQKRKGYLHGLRS